MFLIIVYAHSKWLDVCPMKTATTAATIERLRWSFATHGLPDTIVSDNGTVFTSGEFSNFLQSRGIRHVHSAPYHTATNELAERAMQSVKQGLAKITQRTISERVTTFLLQYYRKTPHSTTGISPAEALMGRRLKLRIDLLSPSLGATVQQKQAQQKWNHDQRVLQVSFNMGDWLFVKTTDMGQGGYQEQWLGKRAQCLMTFKSRVKCGTDTWTSCEITMELPPPQHSHTMKRQ